MCIASWYFGPTCYILGKASMYCLYLLRLQVSYSESSFGYNPLKLKILSVCIYGFAILVSIITMTTFKVDYDKPSDRKDLNIRNCDGSFSPEHAAPLSLLIYDLVFQCILLYKPIQLIKSITINNDTNVVVKESVIKYTILAFVACISSFIVLLSVAILDSIIFQAIDIQKNHKIRIFQNLQQ